MIQGVSPLPLTFPEAEEPMTPHPTSSLFLPALLPGSIQAVPRQGPADARRGSAGAVAEGHCPRSQGHSWSCSSRPWVKLSLFLTVVIVSPREADANEILPTAPVSGRNGRD